jgi:DNA-binding CsgD family transcriptional regulator
LGDHQFGLLRAEGAALTRAAALRDARGLLEMLARDGRAGPGSAANGSAAPPATALVEQLTRREQDVLQLLGQRLTDAEIADHLYIGIRTAEFHVANVMGKLGAPNRRDATATAARLGLI